MSRGHLIVLALLILLGACARSPVLPPETEHLTERVELNEVPFFPQQAYQCGPASLATMLNHRGLTTTPGLLKDRVYLPGREGSLQIEMVAAARAHGLLVYPLDPRLEDLLAEVAAGNPVLVFQNLAFDWWPRWHYAVLMGYDRRERTLILRSGTTRRWTTDFKSFDNSWRRAGRWAVLTLPPGRLPATAELRPWLQAASDLEETGRNAAALEAYRTAVERWPDESVAWFALANGLYAEGDRAGAEQALRESLEQSPDFAAGWFNLSEVLAERGCQTDAQHARVCAQRLAPEDARFTATLSKPIEAAKHCKRPPPCP